MDYSRCTFDQRPEFRPQIDRLGEASWPQFLQNGNITRWDLLFEMFPECQLLLLDPEGALMAVGHTVPLTWDGTIPDLPETIEGILGRAEDVRRRGEQPDSFCAIAAMVDPARRGQGLSYAVIREMRALAEWQGCKSLIAPVRPTWKARYPLTPMERYVAWQREDGAPLDPWLRVHWRLSAQGLCVAPNTLTVEANVRDWEAWTDMAFPDDGAYIVPGALQPVQFDQQRGLGRYEDPNYWMVHSINL
jgi:GNAT superfamily N-acetyltransferase